MESAEAKAERIVTEELKGRRWRPEDLAAKRKGAAAKVAIAVRLRRETTMTLAWITARLQMGTKTHLAHFLYWEGQNSRKKSTILLTDPDYFSSATMSFCAGASCCQSSAA